MVVIPDDKPPRTYQEIIAELKAENERLRVFINNVSMMFEHLGFKTQAHECRAALASVGRTPVPPPLENSDSVDLDRAYPSIGDAQEQGE